MSTVARS